MTTEDLFALARERALTLAQWILPAGHRERSEWVLGDLRVNVGLKPGQWSCETTGARGETFVSLLATVRGISEAAAVSEIAAFLGAVLDPLVVELPKPKPAALNGTRPVPAEHKTSIVRVLPSAIEAEKGLISCFLQSADYTGALCSKHGIGSAHFHHGGCEQVYDHLFYLWGERMECDSITLITHFHANGQLDAIGGAAFISDLFTCAPSTTQAPRYIELLEDRFASREVIRLATEFADRGYRETGQEDLRTLITDFQERAANLTGKRGHRRLPTCDSVADWEDERNLPPEPPQVLHGMLHQGAKLIIGAPSKARKSWSLLDMAVSVANGAPWWGIPTTKGRVCFVNFEVQKFAISRRIRWIAKHRGLAMNDNMQVMTLRGMTDSIEDLARQLIEFFRSQPPYMMIFFDPVFKLMAGRDENKVGDVMVILQNLERIAVETGAAIGISHHMSKGNQANKEAMDRMGGSGAFARDPDAILMMTSHEELGSYTISPILRNFAPVEDFVMRWACPIFERAPDLHPDDLKKQPRANAAKPEGRRVNDALTTAKEKLAPVFRGRAIMDFGRIKHFFSYKMPNSTLKKYIGILLDQNLIEQITVPRKGYQATDQWEKLDEAPDADGQASENFDQD